MAIIQSGVRFVAASKRDIVAYFSLATTIISGIQTLFAAANFDGLSKGTSSIITFCLGAAALTAGAIKNFLAQREAAEIENENGVGPSEPPKTP